MEVGEGAEASAGVLQRRQLEIAPLPPSSRPHKPLMISDTRSGPDPPPSPNPPLSSSTCGRPQRPPPPTPNPSLTQPESPVIWPSKAKGAASKRGPFLGLLGKCGMLELPLGRTTDTEHRLAMCFMHVFHCQIALALHESWKRKGAGKGRRGKREGTTAKREGVGGGGGSDKSGAEASTSHRSASYQAHFLPS